jgi:hypothetical protein
VTQPNPNRISGMCWHGHHARCTGWLIVPDHNNRPRTDISIACECPHCAHPPVSRWRHLHDEPQRGVKWNSSTAIRW